MSMRTPWVAPPGNGMASGELGEGCKINVSCLAHETEQTPLLAKQPFLFFPAVCVIFVSCCWLKIPLASKNGVIWSTLLYLCLGRAHATISCFLPPKKPSSAKQKTNIDPVPALWPWRDDCGHEGLSRPNVSNKGDKDTSSCHM